MDIVVRAAFAFLFVLLLTRIVGRRELSTMQPFDLILLVVIGDLVQQGVTQNDFSVTGIVLAAGTIAVMTVVVSYGGASSAPNASAASQPPATRPPRNSSRQWRSGPDAGSAPKAMPLTPAMRPSVAYRSSAASPISAPPASGAMTWLKFMVGLRRLLYGP